MQTEPALTHWMILVASLAGFALGAVVTLILARLFPRALGLADRRGIAERLAALEVDLVQELRMLERGTAGAGAPRPAPPIRMVPRPTEDSRQEAA